LWSSISTRALLRHLAAIARRAGLVELTAEVLTENIARLKVFEKSGLRLETKHDAGVVAHRASRHAGRGEFKDKHGFPNRRMMLDRYRRPGRAGRRHRNFAIRPLAFDMDQSGDR